MVNSKNKICAVLNLRNHLPFSRALKYFGWCDVYLTSFANKATGLAVPNEDIDDLNIDFTQYDVLLLQHERAPDDYTAKLAKRQNPHIIVIGNQHGYYKSIQQIKHFPPESFDYWNTWGEYWIDRSKKILGEKPEKWINLGSFLHAYYYQTKNWRAERSNRKALVIYEPNTNESYHDKYPEIHSQTTLTIIKTLEKLEIPYDIKAHPLWPNLRGNDNQKMWQPPKSIKDFDIEKIIDYSLIIGSRSTVLLDAVSMGIPVLGLASSSQWEDDEYGPARENLFPYCFSKKQLEKLITEQFNKKFNYNYQTIKYFLGDIKYTDQTYHQACKKMVRNNKFPRSLLKLFYL